MRNTIHGVSLLCAILALAASTADARPWLITDQNEQLYDFNDTAPPANNPRTITVAESAPVIVGIDFSPSQVLYALTTQGVNPPRLYTVNPVTGAATLVGSTGLTFLIEGDIGFDPTDGQLYGLFSGSSPSRRLMTINTSTGLATLVGGTTLDDPSGLAFDNTGNLWVLDTRTNLGGNMTLHRVNKTNGSLIASVTTNLASSSSLQTLGMDFAPNGTLYVAMGNGTFYSLNTTIGAFTNLGSHGVTGATGLAVVPEPSTIALAAAIPLMGLGWAWRRRRKAKRATACS